jgi:hypothetical protein
VSNVNKNTTSSPKSSQSPSKKVTVVAVDSILKHVEGTTSDMEDYLRSVLRKEPNKIILHIGTNDINRNTNDSIKSRHTNYSRLAYNRHSDLWELPRTDKPNLMSKVNQANRLIKVFCILKRTGHSYIMSLSTQLA